MGGLDELRTRVARSYERLSLPSWPDPHADTEAREDEYSRVTEPARYRITHARARVWADELRAVAEVEPLAPAPLDEEGRLGEFHRGVRITSPRPGTLPLLLLERDAPLAGTEGTIAVLHISVARPEVSVAALPDCGCDACDSGSAALVASIDRTIGTIVGSPFVQVQGNGWYARWHERGGGSGGHARHPDHALLMDLCRRIADGDDDVRLPDDTEAFFGRPWL